VLTGIVYAMGQGGAGAEGAQGGFGAFIPLILMFVIFYFLIIRPQQKKSQQHKEMIQNLKKGDRIVTGGGIYGRITGLDDQTLKIEIADNVSVKLNRNSVAALVTSQNQPAKKEKEESKKEKNKDSEKSEE
jgi:preprotein translocase subunit YajC